MRSLLSLIAVCLVGCSAPVPDAAERQTPRPLAPAQPMTPYSDTRTLGGHWRGAIMQDGGSLGVALSVEADPTGAQMARYRITDWIGYDWGRSEIQRESGETAVLPDFPFGGASLQWDARHGQLSGVTGSGAAIHFARALPPTVRGPGPVMDVVVPSGDLDLSATLSLPEDAGPHPAIVIVSGRGCYGRSRTFGRVLPAYGMAVLEYDKRGTGESEGDCDAATQDQLIDDAAAALAWLRADPRIDPTRTGLIGGSAGAWTVQGVAGRALDGEGMMPAFLATYIGSATSIETQQRESGEALATQLGLDDAARTLVSRAVDLTLDRTRSNAAVYDELQAIRREAEAGGWRGAMFDESDFPQSEADVDRLWLRRFDFDPAPVLERLSDTPYLSLLGAEDPIVPLPSNVDALRDGLERAGNERYRIVVIPGTGHGLEHGNRDPVLPDGTTYRKFDTVEPLYFTELIDFLRAQDMLPPL